MPLLHSKLDSYSIDEWVNAFNSVYSKVNAERSIESILLHIVEHASEIQEDLRIARYAQALDHLADAFCWTCALVVKSAAVFDTPQSYNQMILHKFPRRCYHCAEPKCICSILVGPAIEDPATKAKQKEKNVPILTKARRDLEEAGALATPTPIRLPELSAWFSDMYSHLNFVSPLEYTVAHFQEEIGEVAECINNLADRRQMEHWTYELQLELPDVFIWTNALVAKFDYILGASLKYLKKNQTDQTAGITIQQVLWHRYGNPNGRGLVCPRCKQPTCSGDN